MITIIYEQDFKKIKSQIGDAEYIKELIKFLKSPVNDVISIYKSYYHPYVKTNWQESETLVFYEAVDLPKSELYKIVFTLKSLINKNFITQIKMLNEI